MVTGLLDTSIVVDALRSHPPSVSWLANNQGQLGVTQIVRLEVVEGALDRAGEQRAITLLNDFELVEITTSDLAWAFEQLLHLHLSDNVDAFDCLIAATSYRLRLPLYTINIKHFTPLLSGLAQRPY